MKKTLLLSTLFCITASCSTRTQQLQQETTSVEDDSAYLYDDSLVTDSAEMQRRYLIYLEEND